jgi:uncharacterized protein (DUF2147 family)
MRHAPRLARFTSLSTLLLGLVASPAARAAPDPLDTLYLPPFPSVGQMANAAVTLERPAVLGRWVTASGNLEVEIAPCGEALCGTVTRVLGNRSMARGGTQGSEMQPLDTRPALGMQILRGLTLAEGDDAREAGARWFGEIYNRETGRSYRCRVQLDAAGRQGGTLVVRPYVLTTWFGQTQLWRRVDGAVAQVQP